MTTRRGSVAPETDDLADLPFVDDEERAESAWLLARDSDPSAPPPSLKIANDYAELEDLLGSLPSGSASSSGKSWQDEVARAASFPTPRSRPWWRGPGVRWATGGAIAAAAAVAVVVLIPGAPATELEVAIRHAGQTRGGSKEAVVGDHLVVMARPHGTGDLRVFRSDGTLVASCPHGPACRGAYAIDITLDAPVQYQVILVVGMGDASPQATMDTYLDTARAASARIVTYEPINVR